MLKRTKTVPLDYSLCNMTATVYHREGLTRRVLENVHMEWTRVGKTTGGIPSTGQAFLLVIPGEDPIAPGDKVLPGIGPAVTGWEQLNTAAYPDLQVTQTVKPRYFLQRVCHTEARG